MRTFALHLCATLAVASMPIAARAIDFNDLELSIAGNAPQKKLEHVLDLGQLPFGTTVNVTVSVKNAAAHEAVLDLFAFGSAKAVWAPMPPSPINHMTIPPGAARDLVITTQMPSGAGALPLNLLLLASEGKPVTYVTVDALSRDAAVEVVVEMDRIASGLGKAKSDPVYVFCTGPAPVGYTHKHLPTEFWIEGWQVVRDCGNWADCTPAVDSDSDVCWHLSIQGLGADGTESDRLAFVVPKLHAKYELIRSAPALR